MTDDCDANWIEHLLLKSNLAWQSIMQRILEVAYIKSKPTIFCHNVILARLRDKVESQEQKLRKLRQLRGQPDMANANNNGSLTNDLDSIRLMFNEKEKELAMAVTKVGMKFYEKQSNA